MGFLAKLGKIAHSGNIACRYVPERFFLSGRPVCGYPPPQVQKVSNVGGIATGALSVYSYSRAFSV